MLSLIHIFLEAGYETEIYAAVIDERLPQGTAQPFDMLEKLEDDDIEMCIRDSCLQIHRLVHRRISRY